MHLKSHFIEVQKNKNIITNFSHILLPPSCLKNVQLSRYLPCFKEDLQKSCSIEAPKELLFFPKRGEEKVLICRAAVKLEGLSPKSKPVGAAWLDGLAERQIGTMRPAFWKNNND